MAKTLKNRPRRKTMKNCGGSTAPRTPSSHSVANWEKWVEKYKAYLAKEGKHIPATPTWEEHKALPRYRNSRGESLIRAKENVRAQESMWMHDVYSKLTGKVHKTLSRKGLF